MDHEKKLAWISKMTKMGLDSIPHYDVGGAVAPLAGPGTSVVNSNGPAGSRLGSMLGVNNNFSAGAANVQAGTNQDQLSNAYSGAQNAIGQQQDIANTMMPQAGQAVAQQAGLANAYTNQMNGLGPNVAQNELNQATGQNVAQQASLMAGQRGAGANAGLMARENAQQGAATQQQAVGQAATLGAQQQIAAEQNLANLSATQANQAQAGVQGLSNAQQNEQGILQGANTAYNNAGVGMQSNINNANAQTSIANQQAGQNVIGGLLSGASGALSGVAGSIGKLFGAEGGVVPEPNWKKHLRMCDGGAVKMAGGGPIVGNPLVGNPGPMGPQSFAGQWLSSNNTGSSAPNIAAMPQRTDNSGGEALSEGISDAMNANYGSPSTPTTGGLTMPELGSSAVPGPTNYTLGSSVSAPAGAPSYSGALGSYNLKAKGGKVNPLAKDEKATKKDNSYDNDKVPAMLSEGEIVLPRSITMHPMAPERAAEFVRRVQAKKGMRDVRRTK